MTFPLDPGLRAFKTKEAERALFVDSPVPPVLPAGSQADDAEHAAVTPPRPADDAALQPS